MNVSPSYANEAGDIPSAVPAPTVRLGASCSLLVVGSKSFQAEDWLLATDALGSPTLFDVAGRDCGLSTDDLAEFTAITSPDAVLVDWDWNEAAAFIGALLACAATSSIPIMILSSDGEESPDRMRCGVWEDPRPECFDEIVALLDRYLDRTAVQRMMAIVGVLDLFERLLSVSPFDSGAVDFAANGANIVQLPTAPQPAPTLASSITR